MRWPVHMFDFGYYGPGSVSWKVNREWIVLLGGTRAVLMQIAHPLVALGVSNHSSYMTDPFGRAERTFILGEKLTFGSSRTAHQAARTINNLHKHVHGHLPTEVGAFANGARYDARDPELLLWVHATLVDTLLLSYQVFVGPLTHAEEEQYYQESKTVARLLGLLEHQMPRGIDDLKQYVHKMVHSDHLAPTIQARELAYQTLFPPASRALRPLMHLNLNVTNALLPPPVREIYNLEWSASQQLAFELSARSARLVVPRMPAMLRELPITRRLMRGEQRKSA
ncbi:MAG TPA: oxygenase MpaB family protein [Ktedonobacteraceae bacterium]